MSRRSVRWWWALAIGAALLVVIQAIPYGHTRTNPPVIGEPAWNAPETRELAVRACYDCHSNQTKWPAYARIAPVSWLVTSDVAEARAKLNFSEWSRPQKEAKEAEEVVRKGEMPMRIYTLMHASARLTDAERMALAEGLAATLGTEQVESGGRR